ncbi:MAG: MerR family transcriptional regulator [Bacillus sp. (in: firmicutes)]
MYKISELARLASVSVRTLHHYDAIGLLKPSHYSASGYRLYSSEDAEKLQQILFFKELGFPLQDIQSIIMSPNYDKEQALLNQRSLLQQEQKRLEEIIRTIDETIQANKEERSMEGKDLFRGLSRKELEEHQKKYRAEAIEKYGQELVEQTENKTSQYSDERWNANQQEMNEIYKRAAAAMDLGPDSPEAQQAVSDWRQFITINYYDCTLDIFRGLADLYVHDERFLNNIDQTKPGLANFLSEAIKSYCAKATK